MRNILPRLRNLLTILIRNDKPVPVKEMAEKLRVSRRTVFRELRNVDSLLAPYGLGIDSRSGEGLLLAGPERARVRLGEDLEIVGGGEPADRRERHQSLVLCLLENPGQKLFYYADRFRVSAATISHDLDEIEPWLADYRLALVRRAGAGPVIEGGEGDIRRILLSVLLSRRREGDAPPSYPSPDLIRDLDAMAEELEPLLAWISPQSREAFTFYLAVMIQRLMDGAGLPAPGGRSEVFLALADDIADILAECFGVSPNRAERNAVSLELAACRPVAESPDPGSPRDPRLESLAHRMIERFDPELAPLLRMDEKLVDGLVSHLRSAVVRLENRIELSDPLLMQMIETYPEVMAGCRRAGEVLESGGGWLPESEISFLAAHFGAATLRLSEQGLKRRPARIGVVCIHGIGASYLLASQVKEVFGAEANPEVSWRGDRENWEKFDFLVSTTPLDDSPLPVVVVAPFLDDDAKRRIGQAIGRTVGAEQSDPAVPGKSPLTAQCRTLAALAGDIQNLLDGFTVVLVPAAVDFTALAGRVAAYAGESAEDAARIGEALAARERLASQVVPELGLVLLHCRTGGVSGPRAFIAVPRGGQFANPYFHGARSCLALLMPEASIPLRGELMGEISAALIKDRRFLAAVLAGDGRAAAGLLDELLRAFLVRWTNGIMQG